MSDTPETDNLARGNHVVPTEWAERLERERDAARRQCLQWLEEWHLTDKARRHIKAERDEAIRQRNETNESSKFAVQYAERERDEALAKHPDGTCLDCGGPLQAVRPGKEQCNCCDNLRHIETMLEETAKRAATLKRERDEARKQLENHIASTIHSCHDECQRPLCVLRRERDEAQKEALYYKTRYEILKDSINVFAAVEKTEQDFQQ